MFSSIILYILSPFYRDDASDTSSLASQQSGSYDPNKADMAGSMGGTGSGMPAGSELVPTAVDEGDDGGIQLISAKPKPGRYIEIESRFVYTLSPLYPYLYGQFHLSEV